MQHRCSRWHMSCHAVCQLMGSQVFGSDWQVFLIVALSQQSASQNSVVITQAVSVCSEDMSLHVYRQQKPVSGSCGTLPAQQWVLMP